MEWRGGEGGKLEESTNEKGRIYAKRQGGKRENERGRVQGGERNEREREEGKKKEREREKEKEGERVKEWKREKKRQIRSGREKNQNKLELGTGSGGHKIG